MPFLSASARTRTVVDLSQALRTPAEGIEITVPWERFSVFARRYEDSAVIAGLPLYAVAVLRRGDGSDRLSVPLGLLESDHVGYASFDLGVLREEAVLARLIDSGGDSGVISLEHLWLLPFADPQLVVDALALGDLGPDVLALHLELSPDSLAGRPLGRGSGSMQSPGILDWRMSPGSFSLSAALVIGQDGSETFLPAHLSSQQFRFRQVARVGAEPQSGRIVLAQSHDPEVDTGNLHYRLGYVFDYTSEWFGIGHSLGTLAYSHALAPGEISRIAVVDWSRSDAASRAETTGLSESLEHDTLRDRSLSETVDAVLDEWQRGGSIMGGVAASGGYGSGGMGVGVAGALGGAYATSSGTRSLTANTTQDIADAFHQASSSLRELRSTVIVQSTQSDTSQVNTRVVANYNHGHAMTLLYYEVLRHYRVVTSLSGVRPAILVDYSARQRELSDNDFVSAHRAELEAVLLDQRMAPYFDDIDAVAAGRIALAAAVAAPAPPAPSATVFENYNVTFRIGSKGVSGEAFLDVYTADGVKHSTYMLGTGASGSDQYHFTKPGHDGMDAGDTAIFSFYTSVDDASGPARLNLTWGSLRSFVVGQAGGSSNWTLDHVTVQGFAADGSEVMLYDGDYGREIPNDDGMTERLEFIRPPAGSPAPQLTDFVSAASQNRAAVLLRHLDAHSFTYNRALWMGENANARASEFESRTLHGVPLLDLVENRAVELSGLWMAFPVAPGREDDVARIFSWQDQDPATPSDSYVEQLLTLPTRGLFAEAKLGSSNANEVIDNTRFWDWQTSPIPETAPTITGADAGSRYEAPTGLAATAFPQSLVNIVSPTAEPDPTGLGDALKVLGTASLFRDMSATQEVATLLGKLSDNATSLASKAMSETGATGSGGSTAAGGATSGSGSGGGSTSGSAPAPSSSAGGTSTAGTATSSPSTSDPSAAHGGGSAAGGTASPAPSGGAGVGPAPSSTAAPVVSKPTAPVPAPSIPGLSILLIFDPFEPGELPTGLVTVKVTPSSGVEPGQSIDPASQYVVGSTVGPPTVSQSSLAPRIWQNVPIVDGQISLDAGSITHSSAIAVEAHFDARALTPAQIQAAALAGTDISTAGSPTGTFVGAGVGGFTIPSTGRDVVMHVSAESKPFSVSNTLTTSLGKTISETVGVSDVISVGFTFSKAPDTASDTVSASGSYLTGKLTIV